MAQSKKSSQKNRPDLEQIPDDHPARQNDEATQISVEEATKIEQRQNADCVEALETLLTLAKAGQVRGLAMAFALAPENGGKILAGGCPATLASVCLTMAHQLAHHPFDHAKRMYEARKLMEGKS